MLDFIAFENLRQETRFLCKIASLAARDLRRNPVSFLVAPKSCLKSKI